MTSKKFFRCSVCSDIHYGMAPPDICPTCGAKKAYCVIEKEEAEAVQSFIRSEEIKKEAMGREKLKEIFKEFADGQEFELNPDEKHLNMVLEGVLANEKSIGLKYCPCQLRSGDFDTDLKLLCPCNFKLQETYRNEARCWCGLFTKRLD
ncbi:MAG: ferredoxin-thioredoxin reductase catalytic domain-containing protein [Candidatus Hydrothermarchaeales archaeon]